MSIETLLGTDIDVSEEEETETDALHNTIQHQFIQ